MIDEDQRNFVVNFKKEEIRMKKRVYVSADYDKNSGDRNVVTLLNKWVEDKRYKVDFVDMAEVASGTVARNPDCRACDLKAEFNRQINASSEVVCIVGDKTASRTAGSQCERLDNSYCPCTPYKQNANGSKYCKIVSIRPAGSDAGSDVGNINRYSYLRHEFEQAHKKGKRIIILFNSIRCEWSWLPAYMEGKVDDSDMYPFWKYDEDGHRVGNYEEIRFALGF